MRRTFQVLVLLFLFLMVAFGTVSLTGCSSESDDDSGCGSCDECDCGDDDEEDEADNSENVGT